MLKPDLGRWNQTPRELRELATGAAHPRTRERFLALHEISQGSCPSRVARQSGRNAQTVMSWVHRYNQDGPAALEWRRSGGHPPFVRGSSKG